MMALMWLMLMARFTPLIVRPFLADTALVPSRTDIPRAEMVMLRAPGWGGEDGLWLRAMDAGSLKWKLLRYWKGLEEYGKARGLSVAVPMNPDNA